MSLNIEEEQGLPTAITKRGKKYAEVIYRSDKPGELKEIRCPGKTVLEQMPRADQREILYITGPSGVGKSTYASAYIKKWKSLFPDKKVWVISRVSQDPAFDEKMLDRISLDEVRENDLDSDMFSDCLVLFDDVKQMPDDVVKKVLKLRDDLLETGRHKNVYMVCTGHIVTNYKESRTVLNEADSVTIFPAAGWHHNQRFLKEYCGFSDAQSRQIKDLPSRWVTIFPKFPQTILTEQMCKIAM